MLKSDPVPKEPMSGSELRWIKFISNPLKNIKFMFVCGEFLFWSIKVTKFLYKFYFFVVFRFGIESSSTLELHCAFFAALVTTKA